MTRIQVEEEVIVMANPQISISWKHDSTKVRVNPSLKFYIPDIPKGGKMSPCFTASVTDQVGHTMREVDIVLKNKSGNGEDGRTTLSGVACIHCGVTYFVGNAGTNLEYLLGKGNKEGQ